MQQTAYLSTLATSVPSECLFSKAGELVSAKRNRLKDNIIDMMLFLNKCPLLNKVNQVIKSGFGFKVLNYHQY